MTYDGPAQWDLQGVKVGAWAEGLSLDQWQRKWSEPRSWVRFLLLLSQGTVSSLPSVPHSPANGPSPPRSPGRPRWEGGISSHFSVPHFPPLLSWPSSPHSHVFLQVLPSFSPLVSRAPWRNYLYPLSLPLPISTSPLISWAPPI